MRSLAVATMLAFGAASPAALMAQPESMVAEAVNNYFVYFNEPGAAKYEGGTDGYSRTASARSGEKFVANRPEVASYRAHLHELQTQRIREFEGLLGRSIVVEYRYDILDNGITVKMTASEAAVLAGHPDVRSVDIVRQYDLATDRGPQFIGADQIWSGLSSPGAHPYRGQGMVIGVFDTGVNPGHPSFANDAACGFSAATPKLIAAKDCLASGTCAGPDPVDANGHGSHTASTAGGNQHVATGGDLAGTQVSGVAPCAQLITYKVCATSSCDGAAIQAAIQTALVDQVDVVNFSISGGQSPWTDNDRGFLDLVNNGTLVAASAGNTSATVTNPIGTVNHRGPWVLTVANSSHDRISNNAVSVAGGPQNVYGLKSDAAFPADITAQVANSAALGNLEGCTAGGGFTAGSMTGKIALIARGTCTFEEKINNAVGAGAIAVIIRNNSAAPPIPMGLGTATMVPSLMIGQAAGQAIATFLTGNPTALATIDADTVVGIDPSVGDILNASSLRGPIAGGIEVTKPDITAPGTNIFAAYFGAANSYEFLSGTSMSGPHVAGSAALVKGLRPSWSVTEVKSALQMTAKKTGLKDFTNGTPNNGQWDADDVGNGRVDLTKAARAGLVMNETYANFLAANGNQANQRALNLPSARNTACTPSCTFTRTVRNTLPGASSWTAAAANLGPGFTVSVSPTSFSFTGAGIPAADSIFANGFDTPVAPETRVITITATPTSNMTAIGFGEVTFTEATARSPDLHVTVAVRGNGGPGPADITVSPTSLSGSATVGGATVAVPLVIGNVGGSPLNWSQGSAPTGPTAFWDQPVNGTSGIVSDYSTLQAGGAYTANDFTVTANTALTEIYTPGFDNSSTLGAQATISWAIYPDVAGAPSGNPQTAPGSAVWTYSAAPTAAGVTTTSNNIRLNLTAAGQTVNLTPGTYWLTVYPTYAGNITGAADPRWNWYQAAPVMLTGSKLFSPLFNVNTWTLTGTGGLNTAIQDTAMTLTGNVAGPTCGASWLSIAPTSGSVAASGTQNVSVSLNPTGLVAGTYTTNVCIASNDPDEAFVTVPVTFTVSAPTGVTVNYDFENVAGMFTSGWVQSNQSTPVGASTFVQGATALAPAQAGTATSFAVVNFNSTTGVGTISNWMLTPVITFDSSTSLSFYTRGAASAFPDRLEVRVSNTGASTNVGSGAAAVGDFTTLLLTVNPTLVPGTGAGGYPANWTQFTVNNASGIPTSGSGRVAFRYYVTDAGPSGSNSDIIGFDTVQINAAGVAGSGSPAPTGAPVTTTAANSSR